MEYQAVKTVPKERETYSSWRGTKIDKLFKQLRKERKEEDEARVLLEEMQKILEEAQARASATEQKLPGKYDEYMRTWTADRGRPHFMDNIVADVTEQRHQVPQFNKRLRRAVGHGTTSRVVRPDETQNILDRKGG